MLSNLSIKSTLFWLKLCETKCREYGAIFWKSICPGINGHVLWHSFEIFAHWNGYLPQRNTFVGNMVEWFQNRFDFVLKAIRQINDQCLTQCPTTPCVYFCQWTHFWESMMINIWSARQISNQIGPGYRFSPAGAISNIKMQFSPSLRNKNGLFSRDVIFCRYRFFVLNAIRSSKGVKNRSIFHFGYLLSKIIKL